MIPSPTISAPTRTKPIIPPPNPDDLPASHNNEDSPTTATNDKGEPTATTNKPAPTIDEPTATTNKPAPIIDEPTATTDKSKAKPTTVIKTSKPPVKRSKKKVADEDQPAVRKSARKRGGKPDGPAEGEASKS